MKSATDKIVLFHPHRIAELIGGHAGDVIAIMKALNQNARNEALTWFHQDKTAKPWPLAVPSARGARLVDLRTEQLCEGIHEAALAVRGRSEDELAATMNPWHRLLMTHWSAGKHFDRFQFHRDELARWTADYGIESVYSFNDCAAAEPSVVKPIPRLRLQEDQILALVRTCGFIPDALPARRQGTAGPKSKVRKEALKNPALFTDSSFDKAWERLRNDARLAGGE